MEMNHPKPPVGITSLEDALRFENSSGVPVKTFVGYNCGSRTFTLVMTLFEILAHTDVANDPSDDAGRAQRKLDMPHATNIAKYILKGLLHAARRARSNHGQEITNTMNNLIRALGEQPYIAIPPLVTSFRNCDANGTNLKVSQLESNGELACFKIYVNLGDTFWVVDGQHRRKGIQIAQEFLDHIRTYKRYPAKSSLSPDKTKRDLTAEELKVWEEVLVQTRSCTVSLEVHLGLNLDQERQLFHDLNNLGKKVERSLAFQFDISNPVNLFVKEDLIDGLFQERGYEISPKDKVNWGDEGSGLTWKDLLAINAVLFLNKTTVNNASQLDVDTRASGARHFWSLIPDQPGVLEPDAKRRTILAQPVVLKALVKLWYDFNWGKNTEWNNPQNQQILAHGINQVDFGHENPMWRYFELNDSERSELGIADMVEYLPSMEGGNRDIGTYDAYARVFRFGAKHNDIFPILGDMIRWKLGLPKRHKGITLDEN